VSKDKFFTLVFEGDIREFKDNPLLTQTPFGVPVAVSRGNALDEIEDQHNPIEADRDVDLMLWLQRFNEPASTPQDEH
jgi:hypothetical protein